jgi:hypothetical protein
MDQIHLSPLVDQIQLTLGHISNISCLQRLVSCIVSQNQAPTSQAQHIERVACPYGRRLEGNKMSTEQKPPSVPTVGHVGTTCTMTLEIQIKGKVGQQLKLL